MQERFHKTSPSDFESTFIKARDSETKEGLKVEESMREPRRGCFGSLRIGSHSDRSEPRQGCC